MFFQGRTVGLRSQLIEEFLSEINNSFYIYSPDRFLERANTYLEQETSPEAHRHIRKVYGCRGCETAPVTADKPAQLIEKSMTSPSVLAMLLTTKSVDGLPLHRFETVLSRHGIDIPCQTLTRWVIPCSEHFQPLLNLMRDRLLESLVIHCDETRVQVLKEPDRDPTSQSWMWVQASGPSDKKVVLFDYTSSRAQDLPLRLLDSYRGYDGR